MSLSRHEADSLWLLCVISKVLNCLILVSFSDMTGSSKLSRCMGCIWLWSFTNRQLGSSFSHLCFSMARWHSLRCFSCKSKFEGLSTMLYFVSFFGLLWHIRSIPARPRLLNFETSIIWLNYLINPLLKSWGTPKQLKRKRKNKRRISLKSHQQCWYSQLIGQTIHTLLTRVGSRLRTGLQLKKSSLLRSMLENLNPLLWLSKLAPTWQATNFQVWSCLKMVLSIWGFHPLIQRQGNPAKLSHTNLRNWSSILTSTIDTWQQEAPNEN